MRLLTLRLENFQGLRSEEYRFEGQSVSIFGDNATGKTTLFNAITWLLFDKASTGAKNFTPKTKGDNGDLHYLDHAAEAIFSLEDGRIISLRKVFHENYKKKRGSSAEEFDGHSVDYFIDGVPVKEKEYTSTLQEISGGPELMKMLTIPSYFPEEMAWDARRKILLEICGDVSDADVIANAPELEELSEFLLIPGTQNQYYSVDEYKKIAASKKADINKQLQGIPGRINEAQRAKPDISEIDAKVIDERINNLTEQKGVLEAEKAQALNDNSVMSKLKSLIAEAKTELAEARAEYSEESSRINESVYAAIHDVHRRKATESERKQSLLYDIEQNENTLDKVKNLREHLINQYDEIHAETWDEGKATCPTCHRLLPEGEIQNLKEEFNQCKSSRLEKINAQGQKEASKEIIASLLTRIETLRARTEKLTESIMAYDQEIVNLQDQIQSPVPFENTEKYINITKKIEKLHAKERDNNQLASSITAEYDTKIQALQIEIRELEEIRSKLAMAERQEKRIAELKSQEKELSRQYEILEKGIYLCEVFVKTKVSFLTDRINSKFKSVSFRLFIEQINGGIKEDCEVMIPTEEGRMVPYSFANNAARINAGLEIIDALSKHWQLTMPIFVDNAESVTRLMAMDNQVIRLVVSEPDKQLRLVLDKPKKTKKAS